MKFTGSLSNGSLTIKTKVLWKCCKNKTPVMLLVPARVPKQSPCGTENEVTHGIANIPPSAEGAVDPCIPWYTVSTYSHGSIFSVNEEEIDRPAK